MSDLKSQIEARAPELARALLEHTGTEYKDIGGWLKCRSPFRPDNNPSFIVSSENGHYEDKGRDERGDVFQLAAQVFDLNAKIQFPDLLDKCAALLGISANGRKKPRASKPIKESPESPLALVKQYGLEPSDFRAAGWMPRKFQYGQAFGYPVHVVIEDEDGGYTVTEPHEVTKYKKVQRDEKGKRYAPWFAPKLTGLGAKGSDALIVPRGSLDRLEKQNGLLVIGGGEEKALAAHKAGYAALSCSTGEGAPPSDIACRWLKDLGVTSIVIAFDADDAGHKGAAAFTKQLQQVTRDVRTVQWEDGLHEGYDLNDALIAGGLDEVRRRIESATLIERKKNERATPKIHEDVEPPLIDEDSIVLDEEPEHPDLPEFPVDALPDPIARWVHEMGSCYQVPTDLPGMLALGAISAAVCGKYRVQAYDSWRDANPLFVATFLPPGERKSPPASAATAPIYRWQDQRRKVNETLRQTVELKLAGLNDRLKRAKKGLADGHESAETECAEILAEINELPKPPPDRLLYDDATVEALAEPIKQNGEVGAIISDEGKIFDNLAGLYSGGVPSFQFFLKAYDGSNYAIDRVTRGQIILKRPTMTLAVAVQPGVLDKLANTSGTRDLGLMGRFLFAYPRSKMGERASTRGRAVAQSTRERYDRIITTLLNAKLDTDGDPPVVSIAEPGLEYLQELEMAMEKRLKPGEGDLAWMSDWAGKLLGKCIRIAALLHCVRHTEGESMIEPDGGWLYKQICRADVESAWRICEYAIEHAKAVYRRVGYEPRSPETDAEKMKERCLLMEEKGQEISHRSLKRTLKRLFTEQGRFNNDKFLDTVNDLVTRGWLVEDHKSFGGNGSRHRTIYHIHSKAKERISI